MSARVTVEVDDRWARVAGGRWHRLSEDREEAVRVAGFTLAPIVYVPASGTRAGVSSAPMSGAMALRTSAAVPAVEAAA